MPRGDAAQGHRARRLACIERAEQLLELRLRLRILKVEGKLLGHGGRDVGHHLIVHGDKLRRLADPLADQVRVAAILAVDAAVGTLLRTREIAYRKTAALERRRISVFGHLHRRHIHIACGLRIGIRRGGSWLRAHRGRIHITQRVIGKRHGRRAQRQRRCNSKACDKPFRTFSLFRHISRPWTR